MKQTMVANSTTKAEYIAASNYRGQVLWIQNQLLDYGYNFMQSKIHIDNDSTICIVKNLVFHSKTKHIEIRHHFIRDSYEKKLIQMIKIHTDQNVADLLTKAFDGIRVNAGDSKLMLLGINLLMLEKVNAVRHNLLLMVPHERVEILLQSLPDSYDQLIINLTNDVVSGYLVFDDVTATIPKEENRLNHREDKQTSLRKVDALVVTKWRSREHDPSGSHNHGKSKS
ncbi:hypothetical protein Tco_0597347 [Tanacetum coccineum]